MVVTAPEASTATLMFIAHRAAESQVLEALRAGGFSDLTLAQCRIAQRLNPAGMRVTELAEQARVTKQTAGALVEELERSDYVVRRPDPQDGRARLVLLSARGEQLCAAAAAEVARVEAGWRAHLGTTAFRQLTAALVSLREITDPDG